MFDNYDEKQKAALSIATVALFSFTIATFAAAIAVGFIYGAGYGFGLFALISLLLAVYFYVTACVKSYRYKKSKQRYREILANSIPTTLDTSQDTTPSFTVVKVKEDE
jgi:O-antigen/teichoic acid export membrane protein